VAHIIRVGPAGWSYKDWKGIVYPPHPPSKFDELAYLSGYFDTIEINNTFYRPPEPRVSQSWVSRAANPAFKFTVKLYKVFTHERGQATDEDYTIFRAGIEPMAKADKLGALLVQFPWSFKNTEEDRAYLAELLERFKDYPLVVEVRHASWNRPAVYQSLERRRVGFCNIDQPLFKRSIEPSALTTASVGYVRLHGRNYGAWFSENAKPADRYDYLYSADELDPWIDNIKAVADQAEETYVVLNNHNQGKGVVNALQVKSALTGQKVPAPPSLFESYPELEDSAVPA
jgi:uncharacterized protein YecE (DUF72 family)